jgi:hypothetical protein
MLRLLHRSLGLTGGDRVVRRVDRHQEIALANVLIVGNGQLDDAPRNFRGHGDDIGPHSGIARPRRSHVRAPCRQPERPGKGDRHQRDQESTNMDTTSGGNDGFWHGRDGGPIIDGLAVLRLDIDESHDEPLHEATRIQAERTIM